MTEEKIVNKLEPRQFLFVMFISSMYKTIPGSFQQKTTSVIIDGNRYGNMGCTKLDTVLPQLTNLKYRINVHGRSLFFGKKSAMDSLIRPWTLIKFLPFALFKYLLKAVSQAFYSTEHGINKQFNPKTK